MTGDISWYLGGLGAGPVLPFESLVRDTYPTLQPGKSDSLRFRLERKTFTDVTLLYSGSYGGALGRSYGGQLGGSLGQGPTPVVGAEERYEYAQELVRYSGRLSIESNTVGVPQFRERLPAGRDRVDSVVVPLRPGADITDARSVWVALTDGSNATPSVGPEEVAYFEFEVDVIAPLGEYSTRDELQDAVEPSII